MKTAEQFLEECKTKWGLDRPENAKQAMIEALKLYAEQAIDICAEDAEVKYKENEFGCFEIVGISKKSILNVKKLLV